MGTNKLAIQVNDRLHDFRATIIDIRTKLLAEGYAAHAAQIKQRYLNARDNSGADPDLAKAGSTLEQLLASSGFLSRPAELLGSQGYGLPQPAEWQKLQASSAERQQQLRRLSDNLEQEVRALLEPTQVAELEQAEANLSQLSQHLRALHKANGGLVLP